jgi:hypothetical protein
MYYDDHFNPSDPNDVDNNDLNKVQEVAMMNVFGSDRGLNVITRAVKLLDGRIKNKKIRVYSSGVVGSNIRDAETGEYFNSKVGSKEEDLFFKVILATGECKSKNGSSTLFFTSPQNCMSHLHCELDQQIINIWEEKRNNRIKAMSSRRKNRFEYVEVR